MQGLDLFVPGTQVFSGTVKAQHGAFGELVTDSGVAVTFTLDPGTALVVGSRVTIVARKYQPLFHVVKVAKA